MVVRPAPRAAEIATSMAVLAEQSRSRHCGSPKIDMSKTLDRMTRAGRESPGASRQARTIQEPAALGHR